MDAIEMSCEYLGMTLLFLMGILATLQILFRFVTSQTLGFSVTWTGELTRYFLVFMTAAGIPYAMRTDDHISIRPIVKKLSDTMRKVVLTVANVLVSIVCLVIAYSAYIVSQRTLTQPLPSIDWLKTGYAHAFLGLMFVLTVFAVVEQTYELWTIETDDETDTQQTDPSVGGDPQ